MKNLGLFLVLVFSVVACRQVLPEPRVVELLTAMYLYDEEFVKNVQGSDSVSIYRSVFQQQGCSEKDYTEAIAYYTAKPKVMKRIYEAVKLRLQEYKVEFEQAVALDDSLRNIWVSDYDTLFQSAGVAPRSYAFSIPVDTLSIYVVKVSAKYFDDDSTFRPRLKGYLLQKYVAPDTLKTKKKKLVSQELKISDTLQFQPIKKKLLPKKYVIQESDTVKQKKEVEFKRGEPQMYSLSFTVSDTLVTHIKGFWLATDDADTTANRQHIYLSKFRVFKQPPLKRLVPELKRLP